MYKDQVKSYEGLVHEIRTLNRQLQSLTYKGRGLDPKSSEGQIVFGAQAISQFLTSRLDYLKYEISKEGEIHKVSIYKKFDKTHRCIRAHALTKNVDIKIEGESRGMVNAWGFFEIIPIVLLDNAVKYSLQSSDVKVIFDEAYDVCRVRIENIGPQITKEEMDKIFDFKYRGINVKKTGIGGGGIGLSYLKDICEIHKIDIKVECSEPCANVSNIPYCNIAFELLITEIYVESI